MNQDDAEIGNQNNRRQPRPGRGRSPLLEEITRFILNDAGLSQRLKDIRHELVSADLGYSKELLLARDADGDVGATIAAPGQNASKELPVLVISNSRRVQEALRAIEELAKVRGLPLNLTSEKFERARFATYTLEKEIVFKLLRQDKLKVIKGYLSNYRYRGAQRPLAC